LFTINFTLFRHAFGVGLADCDRPSSASLPAAETANNFQSHETWNEMFYTGTNERRILYFRCTKCPAQKSTNVVPSQWYVFLILLNISMCPISSSFNM
jgi:hypothetical protein